MRRREFITLFGGGVAAAASAPDARAQGDRVRHVAALIPAAGTTPGYLAILREELQKLGWREGRNLRIDVRVTDDPAALQVAAEEVVKSAPEVIFAVTGPFAWAVQVRTRAIPIVFQGGGDPGGHELDPPQVRHVGDRVNVRQPVGDGRGSVMSGAGVWRRPTDTIELVAARMPAMADRSGQ